MPGTLRARERRHAPGRRIAFLTLMIWVTALAACGGRSPALVDPPATSAPDTPVPAATATAEPTPTAEPPLTQAELLAVNDFLYQLQRARPARIGETAFDLVVVSMAAAGNSPDVLPALKHSAGGDKIILCYMSIGQAETYREYWNPAWREDPPVWLDAPDETWSNDYWVRYWEPEWQQIIFGAPDSYLDRLMGFGCDGVYLDRVDAYRYFQDRDGRETAAREMADFVIALAAYARAQRPGFAVFPQNAEELGLMFPDYLAAVNGIGVEDLYYGYPRDHAPSPPEWTAERERMLDRWVEADKLVLTIDYTEVAEQIADAYARARARGYVPYVTDRSLGRLRINPGFEPD